MTKPLDQVKSDLAAGFTKHNAYEYPDEVQNLTSNAVSYGFDAAISHLASVGVSGAREFWIADHEREGLVRFAYPTSEFFDEKKRLGDKIHVIELLPVAAQLAKQAERIAELEETEAALRKGLDETNEWNFKHRLKHTELEKQLEICKEQRNENIKAHKDLSVVEIDVAIAWYDKQLKDSK